MKGPAESLRSDGAAKAAAPRLAVVGAGIVGLAHAWAAARRGWEVLLFDRDRRAQGASIRNFGMVWPIGQPAGELYDAALESRSLWQELVREAGLWSVACGSLHAGLPRRRAGGAGGVCRVAPALGLRLPTASVRRKSRAMSPAAKREGSARRRCGVRPKCASIRARSSARCRSGSASAFGVELHFGVPIAALRRRIRRSADGESLDRRPASSSRRGGLPLALPGSIRRRRLSPVQAADDADRPAAERLDAWARCSPAD